MNIRHDREAEAKRNLTKAEDRKTLTMLLTAVYSPLLLILGAAMFLA